MTQPLEPETPKKSARSAPPQDSLELDSLNEWWGSSKIQSKLAKFEADSKEPDSTILSESNSLEEASELSSETGENPQDFSETLAKDEKSQPQEKKEDLLIQSLENKEAHAKTLFDLGISSIAEKKYQEAFTSLEQAMDFDPNMARSFVYWYGYGLASYHLGKYDRTVIFQENALLCEDENQQEKIADAWYNLGQAYEKQKQFDKANNAYQQAATLDSKYTQDAQSFESKDQQQQQAEKIFQRGSNYWHARDYQSAYESYQQAIELNPNCSVYWYYLGLVAQKLERLPLAILASKKAYAIDSEWREKNRTDALYLQTDSYYHLGFATEAIAVLERVAKNAPSGEETQPHLSFFTQRVQSKQKAARLIEEGFDRLDNESQQEIEAIHANFKQAVELAPHVSLCWYGYAIALYELKKYEESLSAIETALLMNNQWWHFGVADAWYYRGLNLAKLGQIAQAKSSYQQALSLTGYNYPLVHEAYAELVFTEAFPETENNSKNTENNTQQQEYKLIFQPQTEESLSTEIVAGEWLEKLKASESGIDLIVNVVPALRELDGGRDLAASIYNLIFRKQHEDKWSWIGLGWNSIVLIPGVEQVFQSTSKTTFFETLFFETPDWQINKLERAKIELADIEKLKEIIAANWDKEVYKLTSYWKQFLHIFQRWLELMPELLFEQHKKQLLETLEQVKTQSETKFPEVLEEIKVLLNSQKN